MAAWSSLSLSSLRAQLPPLTSISLLSPSWFALAAVLTPVCLGALYVAMFSGRELDSPNFYNNKSEKFKQMRKRKYPPSFPRGWYCVASLAELRKGK